MACEFEVHAILVFVRLVLVVVLYATILSSHVTFSAYCHLVLLHLLCHHLLLLLFIIIWYYYCFVIDLHCWCYSSMSWDIIVLPLPFVIVANHHHHQLLLLIVLVTNNCYYYSSSLTSTWSGLKYLQGTLFFVVHFIPYYSSLSLTIVCVLLSS